MTPTASTDPLTKASRALGTGAALARRLGRSRAVIGQWRKRVPAEQCLAIEAVTREVAAERDDPTLIVTCEDLRPDLGWRVVRENPLPDRKKPASD
jgi:DNA-binding transcriptional regulator YdaS (Cro superfamily)